MAEEPIGIDAVDQFMRRITAIPVDSRESGATAGLMRSLSQMAERPVPECQEPPGAPCTCSQEGKDE